MNPSTSGSRSPSPEITEEDYEAARTLLSLSGLPSKGGSASNEHAGTSNNQGNGMEKERDADNAMDLNEHHINMSEYEGFVEPWVVADGMEKEPDAANTMDLNEPHINMSEYEGFVEPLVVVKGKKKRQREKRPKLLWEKWEEEQERWIDEHIAVYAELDQQSEACNETYEQPADLLIPLFRYQKQWLSWALKQEAADWKGGILADEMGLGKTIQAIALVLAKREMVRPVAEANNPSSSSGAWTEMSSTLVICPTTALTQWKNEIERSTSRGSVKVLVHFGPKRENTPNAFQGFDFVLTTYKTIEVACRKSGLLTFRSTLHSVKWERIILDEAHMIKDPNSETTKCILSLESSYKWCLTGTPIQNRANELYPLVCFLKAMPYCYYFCQNCECITLDSSDAMPYICKNCTHAASRHFKWWKKYVDKPITYQGNLDSGRRAMFLLQHKILKSIMLRRTKKNTASDLLLPARTVFLRWDTLDIHEEEYYKSVQGQTEAQLNRYVQEGTLMTNVLHIFALLTRLRQAVDHPYLGNNSDNNAREAGGILNNDSNDVECEICHNPVEDPLENSCTHVFCKACLMLYSSMGKFSCPSCSQLNTVSYTASSSIGNQNSSTKVKGFKDSSIVNRIRLHDFETSTKIEALREEIRFMFERDGSAKGIVFSQFISFLDLIRYSLQKSGIECLQLVGSMSNRARDAAVKRFREDPDCRIFLVSLAVGSSLNLTAASHVFMMDPWWNAAVEQQAQARIHRVGQSKPVRIVRFLMRNTIEERIFELQEKKRLGIEGTVGGVQEFQRLTEQEIRSLFCR